MPLGSSVPHCSLHNLCRNGKGILAARRQQWYGARFSAEMCTRGCHWFRRLLASREQACDLMALHSGVHFSLTSSHCKSRPNTEGTVRQPGNPSMLCTYRNGACLSKQTLSLGPFCRKHGCPTCGKAKRSADGACQECASAV
jgi:hypothetical protein